MDKETLAVMELLPTFSQMQSEAWRSLPPADAHAVGALSTSQLKAVMLIAMRELADGEAMTLGELADAIALKKSATSILVTALEDAGLAVRKADARNGRKVRIRLSAKGDGLARRITAGAARRVAQFLGTLTASERGTFVSVARKFTAFARHALAVAVLAVCVGCNVAPRPAPKSRALVLHGNVDDRELKLAFVISERLARVVPEEGTVVREGDVVATCETVRLENDVAVATAAARVREAELQVSEPISILANPTYLPVELAGDYDRLWTEARMRRVISKAVARGIALEIQAESPYPRPKFLRLAKQMGAKFSFGTNNFDDRPKDLTHWLDVITWLDLHGSDIWTPQDLK